MILCFLEEDCELMIKTLNKVKVDLGLSSGFVSHLETWSIGCFLYCA